MKKILQKILKMLSKMILNKYRPEVIGITGSIGKTSAKEAIYTVLANKFKVRKNSKNYNNEIGLPLTIIGVESPLRSVVGWLGVLIFALRLIIKKQSDYPKILILEMAADRPGDLNYLIDVAQINIAIITSIGDSHLENFKTIENVKQEKATLIRRLDKSGYAVLNIDDKRIETIIKDTKGKVYTYGTKENADLEAKELRIKFPTTDQLSDDFGLSFKLVNQGSFAPVFLPNTISQAGVYAALAGAAVGIIKGMNLIEISQALKNYTSPKGRMKYLPGIKNTFLIDDTYNSSPASSIMAIKTLSNIALSPTANKYAILGDMLELGKQSVVKHEDVGRAVVSNKINKLIVVGERSRDIARGAKASGMKPDDIFHFATPVEAGRFIKERLVTGDVVLVKGSQEARMEKVVQEIMAEPLRAGELLVRQEKEWQK